MIRFIKHSLILILIFFVIVLITGRFDNVIIPADINVIKAKYSHSHDSLDYLFLGNSYVYSGIVPSMLDSAGIKCYNFGVSTAGVEFYEILLEDYLSHVKKPPVTILFLVNPMSFSSASDNWQAYPVHRYLADPLSNEHIAIRFNHYPQYLGMLRKSSTKGFKYISSLLIKPPFYNTDSVINNQGFYPSNDRYSLTVFKNEMNFYTPFTNDKFPTWKIDELISLAKNCQSKGINILFFEIPTFKLNQFFSDSYLKNYYTSLTLIKNNHFEIISSPLDLDSSCFRNTDHMNNKGAALYTEYLIQYLKSHE